MDKMFQKIKDISFENRVLIVINIVYIVVGILIYPTGTYRSAYGLYKVIASTLLAGVVISWAILWLVSGYMKEKDKKLSFKAKLIINLIPLMLVIGINIIAAFEILYKRM